MTDNDPWRRNAIKAAVNRGTQDPRDLDEFDKHGRLTLPSSFSEARRLCVQMAREYVSAADERAAKASARRAA